MQESRLFRKLLIGILLGFSQLASAQIRIKLSDLYSVTFPLKPTQTKTDVNTTVYSANQNGAYYIVTVTNMAKQFNYASNSDSLQHFYVQLRDKTIKKLNAKLEREDNVKVAGNSGLDFDYTLTNANGMPNARFQRSVYVNKTLFSFAFWTFKSKTDATNSADKEIFFNTISAPKEDAPPAPYTAVATPGDNSNATAQKTSPKATVNRVGYSIGYILGAIILTALIVGLIVLIRRTSSPNKKKK